MTVDTFVQITVGAIMVMIGSYLIREKNLQEYDTSVILPFIFFISGWVIIVVGMNFDPFAILAAMLMIFSLFIRGTDLHEMSFLFVMLGSISFAKAVLGVSNKNVLSVFIVILATVIMSVYWITYTPLMVTAMSWILLALIASAQ